MKNRQFTKVDFSKYEGKYDESIKEQMANNPDLIDIETMRANLYGYTFTPEYAKVEIPDEFSMDYWEDHFLLDGFDMNKEIDLPELDDSLLSNLKMPIDFPILPIVDRTSDQKHPEPTLEISDDDSPIYDFMMPQEELILRTIDSTGDGKSPETALCVIDVHMEYEYMKRVFPYSVLDIQRQSVRNGIDCITFKPNIYHIENLYFDITRRFEVGYKH